jgi:hypothetical protein
MTRSRTLTTQSLVTGRVIDGLTGEAPRAAVTLRLIDRDDPDLGGHPLEHKITTDGRFSFFGDPDTAFPRIAEGQHRLRLEAEAAHFAPTAVDIDFGPSPGQPAAQAIAIPGEQAATVNLFVGGGLPLELADLTLDPEPVGLDGRVLHRVTGEGIAEATVELGGGATVPTDENGRFTYAALPVEPNATFTVTAAGFEAQVVVHLIAYGRARNALVVSLQEEAA